MPPIRLNYAFVRSALTVLLYSLCKAINVGTVPERRRRELLSIALNASSDRRPTEESDERR